MHCTVLYETRVAYHRQPIKHERVYCHQPSDLANEKVTIAPLVTWPNLTSETPSIDTARLPVRSHDAML